MSRFITQVVLCDANHLYNTALLVPDFAAVRVALGLANGASDDELAMDARVRDLIDGDIAEQCGGLKKYEAPRGWVFVAPFTAGNNIPTPKMSIRRHMVVKAYEDVVAGIYG